MDRENAATAMAFISLHTIKNCDLISLNKQESLEKPDESIS